MLSRQFHSTSTTAAVRCQSAKRWNAPVSGSKPFGITNVRSTGGPTTKNFSTVDAGREFTFASNVATRTTASEARCSSFRRTTHWTFTTKQLVVSETALSTRSVSFRSWLTAPKVFTSPWRIRNLSKQICRRQSLTQSNGLVERAFKSFAHCSASSTGISRFTTRNMLAL